MKTFWRLSFILTIGISLSLMLIGFYIRHLENSNIELIIKDQSITKSEANDKKSLHGSSGDNISYDFKKVNSIRLKDVREIIKRNKPTNVIATVSIPSIDLKTNIRKGVSEGNLAVGAGTLLPNECVGKGNFAIASHNLNSNVKVNVLFANLHKAKRNMLVYVTDMSKHTYIYRITTVKTVPNNDLDDMDAKSLDGHAMVTMVTCDKDPNRKLIVQGELRYE